MVLPPSLWCEALSIPPVVWSALPLWPGVAWVALSPPVVWSGLVAAVVSERKSELVSGRFGRNRAPAVETYTQTSAPSSGVAFAPQICSSIWPFRCHLGPCGRLQRKGLNDTLFV